MLLKYDAKAEYLAWNKYFKVIGSSKYNQINWSDW